MKTIAIVAGGPCSLVPNIKDYQDEVDYWIGVDKGTECIVKYQLPLYLAIGDFDSVNKETLVSMKKYAENVKRFPVAKDKTDLELALDHAIGMRPDKIYLFGATGGRLDHELANIQLLYKLQEMNIHAIMIDKQNMLCVYLPGSYQINQDQLYSIISFIPFDPVVGLTLSGFKYPLINGTVSFGSTRCVSNQLISGSGTFSFRTGILIVIKSRDVLK